MSTRRCDCDASIQPTRRSWGTLLGWACAVGIVWGVLLPAISQWPAQKRYEQWLDEHRIDPSAMFYTEVDPLMERLGREEALGSSPPATRTVR